MATIIVLARANALYAVILFRLESDNPKKTLILIGWRSEGIWRGIACETGYYCTSAISLVHN